jgi:hypothetical protein
MPEEILEGTPHQVDMVSGRFIPADLEERQLRIFSDYRKSLEQSMAVQMELGGATGQAIIGLIRKTYMIRLGALAANDPQCQAIEGILSALGHQVNVIPLMAEQKLRQHLGPDIHIPFESEAAAATGDTGSGDKTAPGP